MAAPAHAAFGNALGGGVYIAAGSAKISNSTISGNLARGGDNSGDGVAEGGGVLTLAPITVTNCTISNNVTRGGNNAANNSGYGGGFCLVNPSPTITTITGSTFSGNQAIGGNGGTGSFVGNAEGGAVNSYAVVSISGSTFDQNQALAGSDGNSGVTAWNLRGLCLRRRRRQHLGNN